MSRVFTFGEAVPGFDDPVLNEREVRAAAGILFVVMFAAVLVAILRHEFTFLKYGITVFLADFALRLAINPRFAPTLIAGRWIVRNQTPEFVSAAPKRFAWGLGILLAGGMFALQVVANTVSPINLWVCALCLTLMFMETSFGICVGCRLYTWMLRRRTRHCPGGSCGARGASPSRPTSLVQAGAFVGFVVFVAIVVLFFHDHLAQPPTGRGMIFVASSVADAG